MFELFGKRHLRRVKYVYIETDIETNATKDQNS